MGETGGRGHHIWLLFAPTPAKYLRWIAEQIAGKAGVTCEIFPKTVEVTPETPYGVPVRLPLGIHRKTGRWSRLLYPKSPEGFLKLQPRVIPEEILKQINEEMRRAETRPAANNNDMQAEKTVVRPWWTRCRVYETILRYGVPQGARCFSFSDRSNLQRSGVAAGRSI